MFSRNANSRFCPMGTKQRPFHSFDPNTHQCKCGKWERGHKPAKAPVKPRAECQICECTQAVNADGCLGHHGYTRPGYGFIQGDCMGVGHKPYPATDALEQYLGFVQNTLKAAQERLAELPNVESIDFRVQYIERTTRFRKVKTFTVVRGASGFYDEESAKYVADFDYHHRVETANTETRISQCQSEIKRVTARIAAAK